MILYMNRNPWWISIIWQTFQAKAVRNLTNSSDTMILVYKWETTLRFYFCVKGDGKAGRAEFSLLFWKSSIAHWSNANKDTTLHLCFGFLIGFAIWCEVFWIWHTPFSPIRGTEIESPSCCRAGRSSVCGVHRPEVGTAHCVTPTEVTPGKGSLQSEKWKNYHVTYKSHPLP